MTHTVASWERSGLRADRTNFGIVVAPSSQYQESSPFIREVDTLVLIFLSSYSGDWHELGVEYIVGGVAVSRIFFFFVLIPFAVTECWIFFSFLIKMFLRNDSGG